MLESAGSATYHTYVNPLAAAAGVLVVSVCYRLAPEHPLPAAYEDSWAALQWAASARDEWIAEHGDVARLFLAGANIVHDMLLRASGNGGPSIEGAIMLHPWFGGSTLIEGESEVAAAITAGLWVYACPDAVGGVDDPRMNVTRWRPARRRWRSSGARGCWCAPATRTGSTRGAARTTRPWPRARGVARVRRGGARFIPPEARVRERQAAHGPRRGLHSRGLTLLSLSLCSARRSIRGSSCH
uniref:Alpha/beta hydrolase fold-3 domain-containing protein n=1 Tax=Setaria viridis TaxID=4556 RepID=A0A4U6UVG7_SETVI|nr:hypothetical protein SEVIR_4G041802v2 [Setaria viridis]